MKQRVKEKVYLNKDTLTEGEPAEECRRGTARGEELLSWFLWQVGNEGYSDEEAEYSLGKEFGGLLP